MTYAGDALIKSGSHDYHSATLTLTTPDETIDKKVIATNHSYVFDPSTVRWDMLEHGAPFLAIVKQGVLVGYSAEDLRAVDHHIGPNYGQFSLVGSEILDGVDTHVISGEVNVRRTGAEDGVYVVYWVGVEDGLLWQVEAEGEFNLAGLAALAGGIDAETGWAKITVRFFDHGEDVDIETPRLAVNRDSHEATLLADGRVIVAGGYTGIYYVDAVVPIALASVEIYDFDTATWRSVTSVDGMPDAGPELFPSTVKLPDGKVLATGFIEEIEQGWVAGSTGYVEADGDSWIELPSTSFDRGWPEVVLLGDARVLHPIGASIGGQSGYALEAEKITEIYDPVTDQWQPTSSMNEILERQAVLVMDDGRVLVAGGRDDDFAGSSRTEIYDPEADEWLLTGSMNVPQSYPVAVVLSDGRVLVTGVSEPSSDARAGTAEIYDPVAGTWSPTGTMAHPRLLHTLTLLPDGRVLAAGGHNPFGETSSTYSSTEFFDPLTGSWSAGPDLDEPRFNHSATLLPDGRVFLVGGIGKVVNIDAIHSLDTHEFVLP